MWLVPESKHLVVPGPLGCLSLSSLACLLRCLFSRLPLSFHGDLAGDQYTLPRCCFTPSLCAPQPWICWLMYCPCQFSRPPLYYHHNPPGGQHTPRPWIRWLMGISLFRPPSRTWGSPADPASAATCSCTRRHSSPPPCTLQVACLWYRGEKRFESVVMHTSVPPSSNITQATSSRSDWAFQLNNPFDLRCLRSVDILI